MNRSAEDRPVHLATTNHHVAKAACGLGDVTRSTTSEHGVTCNRCVRVVNARRAKALLKEVK